MRQWGMQVSGTVGWRWMVWIAVFAVLGGCRAGDPARTEEGRDRLRQQAADALTRYDKAVLDASRHGFVPIGDLTGQLGEWESTTGDTKRALLSGRVLAARPLPEAPRPTGRVVWDSGAAQTVPLISAGEALEQLALAGAGECPDCAPLEVTAARLATARIPTTRGAATAPAWIYTLKGTAVQATRVAIARAATVKVTPPSWDPYDAPIGPAIESAAMIPGSRKLTVTFNGSPDPRSKPCGADYSTEVVESPSAVVVIVIPHLHAGKDTCGGPGALRTATVELPRPLGERAVLEGQQGLPVSVTISG